MITMFSVSHLVATLLAVSTGGQELRHFLDLNVPFFNRSADSVFTAQAGATAFLVCEVRVVSMSQLGELHFNIPGSQSGE